MLIRHFCLVQEGTINVTLWLQIASGLIPTRTTTIKNHSLASSQYEKETPSTRKVLDVAKTLLSVTNKITSTTIDDTSITDR